MELATVGRVVKAHGLGGEVSVALSHPEAADELVGVSVWVVPPVAGAIARRISGVRPGPKGPLLKIDGIESIGEAQALSGRELRASVDDLGDVWFEEDFDPVGLVVIDEERGELGEVTELIITGANDVWVIDSPRYGQVLLPDIEDVVLEVDEEERTARVRLLRGLIDEDES